MEYFCEWIQKIAYYMILVTLVMQVAAGEGYRKYIRLFTGIILILLILSPVIRLSGLEGEGYLRSAERSYEAAAQQMEEKIQELDKEVSDFYEERGFPGEGPEGEETRNSDGNGEAWEAGKIEVGEIRIGR